MGKMRNTGITYRINPPIQNRQLNDLLAASWHAHRWRDFQPVLDRSLAFVCAYQESELIGFVNLAWDGGTHAFILDTTVHPNFRRRGIGHRLVKEAVEVAEEHHVEWIHVDFEPHLRSFYQACGFQSSEAGLLHLNPRSDS